MKKTITLSYEEEQAIADAITRRCLSLRNDLATLRFDESDCSSEIRRQLRAGRLADDLGKEMEKEMSFLQSILNHMVDTAFDDAED